MLTKVGQPVAVEEKNKRIAGESTLKAIENFQKEHGLTADRQVSEEVINKLHEEAIKATFSAKTQVANLHTTLKRATHIAKLNVEITPGEIKNKAIGNSTAAAIKAFQEKYKLPATGTLDKPTLDKLESVAASRGLREKILKAPAAPELKTVTTNLRLNMTSAKVAEMQKALAHLGYTINEQEFKTQTFGKTTRSAVLAFQKIKGLPETGHVEADTLKGLNSKIIQINPGAEALEFKYRVRGSVRDELWERKPNMVIKVYEKLLNGESAEPLITKKNLLNGFFDITYDPPVDPVTKQAKENFHLVVKLYEPVDNNPANDKLIASQIHYNTNRIHWVNFTLSETEYKGDADFIVTKNTLQKAIGNIKIEDLQETENNKQVTQLSLQTGLSTDDIMRLILSHHAANSVNHLNPLTPEVFYAFIRQNLPPGLPGDLLRGASDWETIDQLTEIASSGIVFIDEVVQQQTIDNAISQNLVSQAVKINRDTILQTLKSLRTTFTLEKPILVGNGNLQTLLNQSKIDAQHYSTVASLFISNKGINTNFWNELNTKSAEIGADAIKDFTTTVEVGNIAKNHVPTVEFLKTNIAVNGSKKFKAASDIAKLDQQGLVELINE
ncbi:MAG TPA: peptidoglycan-binding domain-containing protein, partial [Chitinophagaceae bacterium]|nr:peptidoglycan-binding domain-containing protein [Chitinophagaceae bacterium]